MLAVHYDEISATLVAMFCFALVLEAFAFSFRFGWRRVKNWHLWLLKEESFAACSTCEGIVTKLQLNRLVGRN